MEEMLLSERVIKYRRRDLVCVPKAILGFSFAPTGQSAQAICNFSGQGTCTVEERELEIGIRLNNHKTLIKISKI